MIMPPCYHMVAAGHALPTVSCMWLCVVQYGSTQHGDTRPRAYTRGLPICQLRMHASCCRFLAPRRCRRPPHTRIHAAGARAPIIVLSLGPCPSKTSHRSVSNDCSTTTYYYAYMLVSLRLSTLSCAFSRSISCAWALTSCTSASRSSTCP